MVASTSAAASDVLTTSSTKKRNIELVLEDFLKSEREYILNLKKIVEDYLNPLSKANILTSEEFNTLEGGFSEIYALQANVFMHVGEMSRLEIAQQRIGNVLLTSAVTLKELLVAYCANHPNAASLITSKSDALETFLKSIEGDLKTLIMGLSEPFRHLNKYPTVLQDLHRNLPDAHPDRGDIQRSSSVYRDLKDLCEMVRRQREKQLEFLSAPSVAEMSREGAICHVGTAAVAEAPQYDNPQDRFVALFSDSLLILEIQGLEATYSLVKTVPMGASVTVRKLPGRPVIAIATSSCEMQLEVGSSLEVERWLEAFAGCGVGIERETRDEGRPDWVTLRRRRTSENETDGPASLDVSLASQKLESSMLREKTTPKGLKSPLDDSGFRVDHDLEMVLPESWEMEDENTGRPASFYLRPYPPHRCLTNTVDPSKKSVKMRKDQTPQQEAGDALLLSIVEGYLAVGGEGDSAASHPSAPQLIVAEDEKLLVEEMIEGQLVMTEKSLVDVVYALKDQMDRMEKEMVGLRGQLEREQRARRRLEDAVKHSSLHLSTSTPKPTLDISS